MNSEEKQAKRRAWDLAHQEEQKAKRRARYQAHREENKASAQAYYLAHREDINARNLAYAQTHREEQKVRSHAWYLTHLEQHKASNRRWREAHPEDAKVRSRAHHNAMVAEALRVLGNKCACPGCEISEPMFLTIDHINGRAKGSRRHPILEARDSGWDKAQFQILCWNCNMTKSNRGFCLVHQKAPASNGHSPDRENPQLLLGP